nr:proline-rich receptor-like protein kinase PERK10 [Aegilops tauschii subsp. strangulata]
MEAPCACSFTSSRPPPRAVPVFAHPQAWPRLKTVVPAPASPTPTGSSTGLRRASSPPTRAATTSPDHFSGLALTGPSRPTLPNPYRPCELPLSSLPCAPCLSPALGSAVARGQPHPSNTAVPRPRVSLRHPASGLLSTPARARGMPCPGSAQLLLAAKMRSRANHVAPPRAPRLCRPPPLPDAPPCRWPPAATAAARDFRRRPPLLAGDQV